MNTLNASNITAESYYNLVQLTRLTGYANPIGAARQGIEFTITRDENWNIITAQASAPKPVR